MYVHGITLSISNSDFRELKFVLSQMWALLVCRSRLETCHDWVKIIFLSNSANKCAGSVLLSVPMMSGPSGRSSSAAQKHSLPKQRKQPDLLHRRVLARQTPESNRGPVEKRNLKKWVLVKSLVREFQSFGCLKFESLWGHRVALELEHIAVRVWRCALYRCWKLLSSKNSGRTKGDSPFLSASSAWVGSHQTAMARNWQNWVVVNSLLNPKNLGWST